MIGVFDSGAGGLTALYEIRRLAPQSDLLFLADANNAPYGTKTQSEILKIAKENIKRLRELGAKKILIACCTASTVYPYLSEAERRISVPLITPAARQAAKLSASGRIGVIATKLTAELKTFTKEIKKFRPSAEVFELPCQNFVSIAERCARGEEISGSELREIKKTLEPFRGLGLDTLILGCTHFPHLKREIEVALPGLTAVNPSLEGAKEILKSAAPQGSGKTLFV